MTTVKSLLLAVAALLAVTSSARADTLAHFEAEYSKAVRGAIALGYKPSQTCFPDYCATSMSVPMQGGGWVFVW